MEGEDVRAENAPGSLRTVPELSGGSSEAASRLLLQGTGVSPSSGVSVVVYNLSAEPPRALWGRGQGKGWPVSSLTA